MNLDAIARDEWRPPHETPPPIAPPELPEAPAESPPGRQVEIPEPPPELPEKPQEFSASRTEWHDPETGQPKYASAA
jgi:hypothetical protein